ncbi:MAG TPA: DUF4136 domain-containing protein [Cytophagaceae bacterium]|jgi:hypothetical protein|nr:DUF4136 domain-containing protein [Cytophagaceae bacterium]
MMKNFYKGKNNTRLVLLAVFVVMVLLSSCAPTMVSSDYSRSTDFRNYKTFAWLPKTHDSQNDSQFDNQIVETNIKNLGSGELKSRGYTVDVDQPDLLIDFYVTVANKVEHVSTPVYGYAYNYNNYNNYNGNYNNPYRNNIYSNGNSYYNNNSYLNNNMTTTIVGYKTQDIPYEEGTLTIVILDRKTNELVWKGWSVGTVTDESSFEYELPSDIRRLFKQFPVPVIPAPKTKK